METYTLIAGIMFGIGVGIITTTVWQVNPLIQQIATMRKEGYISVTRAEPRPDAFEPWLDIPED